MITFENQLKSNRPDGRYVCTMAAQMAMLRDLKQEYAFPENCTKETYAAWQTKIIDKQRELLHLPDFTPQPKPVMLSTVKRDGYRVEKWEFYPDDYTAVPFLALIPDEATKSHPVPGVMCFPGSNYSKEFTAGEPLLDHPNEQICVFPERNHMGEWIVKSGMAAFVFDNPGTGETSILTDPSVGETQFETRVQMTHGILDMGYNYVGLSVFQKLCFMKHLETLEYVDQDRIGISGHSLGTEPGIAIALQCKNIKALVFNDFLHSDIRRYTAITEQKEDDMHQNIGNWHIVPGKLKYYGFPELCAALAPRYLALTEGGADHEIDLVKKAYALNNAEDHLIVSYYPAFQDPETRKFHGEIPKYGLTRDEYYRQWSYCLPEDHSFRAEPALRLLKKCFGLE